MRKIFLKLITIIGCCSLMLLACKKDKGNYNITNIDEMLVSGFSQDTIIKLLVGDTLRLKPIIKQQKTSTYTYRWYAYNDHKYELGTRLEIDTIISLPLGSYTLQFEITDTQTGIKSFRELQLQINDKYTNGIVVLEQTPQGGDIAHIGDNDIVFRKLYSSVNGSFITSPSSKLVACKFAIKGKAGKKTLLYISSEDAPTFELDANTYQRNEIPTGTFNIGATLPVKISSIHSLGYSVGAMVDKKFQYSNNGNIPIKFISAIPGDYELAPFALSPNARKDSRYSAPIFMVFDEKNGRFLNFSAYQIAPFSTYTDDLNGKTSAFDINNLKNKKCFFAYYSNTYRYYNWYMTDHNTKETWLYRVGYGFGTSDAYAAIKIPADSRFSESTIFAASTTLPHVYYALDNSVYLYDYSSNQSRVVYTFPASEQVTEMKFSLNRLASKDQNYLSEYTTGDLYIATYNGTEGKISKITVAANGDLASPTKVLGGFGKVTGMYYR